MVQQAEREDQLLLTAAVYRALGGKGLADYQPPAAEAEDKITEAVYAAGLPEPRQDPDSRYDEVMAFIAVAGGEAG